MEDTGTPFRKIILISVFVGIIAGIGALLFFEGLKWGIHLVAGDILGYRLPMEGESISSLQGWVPPDTLWLILPILCLGGLISGIIISKFAPEAEGHGTDAAIKAFHGEGRVRKRVPLVKAVTAIVTISTGGSAGREGPIAQISAGFGSIAADLMGLSPRYRRMALATGIGAGIGTIFTAPLGGAILAAEVLYKRDFETDAIIPAFIASIIGYAIFGSIEGFDPIFGTLEMVWNVPQIPLFIVMGAACAAVGLLYVRAFYGTQALLHSSFQRLGMPLYLKPMFGGFLTGVLVLALAAVLPEGAIIGMASLWTGYGFVQLALYNMLPLTVLIVLPFTKILTTSFTIGSGGSGGVFAPGLAIGGATGGAIGTIFHMAFPSLVPLATVPVFVIIGMIALFGSISNAPIAVLIMVIEMTGDFSLLAPAMGAVAIAYVLTGDTTIFREQVMTKAQSSAHRGEYMAEILQDIPVVEVMVRRDCLITLSPEDPLSKVISLIDETWHTGFPVLQDGRLAGIITIGDLREARSNGEVQHLVVGDCMTEHLVTVRLGQSLEEVLEVMMDHEIHHVPVIEPDRPDNIVGFITTTDILRTYAGNMASRKK